MDEENSQPVISDQTNSNEEFNQKLDGQNLLIQNISYNNGNEDLNEYVQTCKKLHMSVDASIASTLASRFPILEPEHFDEGCKLLPLIPILQKSDQITKVKMPTNDDMASGNQEANNLGIIMKNNNSIEELHLSGHKMRLEGFKELCEGITINNKIKHLDISNMQLGPQAIPYIIKMLESNTSLRQLDISNNSLEQDGEQEIKNIIKFKKQNNEIEIELESSGNWVQEQRLSSAINGIGTLISCIILLLLWGSVDKETRLDSRLARLVQGLSLIVFQLCSCLNFVFQQKSKWVQWVMKSFNHCSIQLLIAGSQTPLCVDGIGLDNPVALYLLFGEWVFCLAGMIAHNCGYDNFQFNIVEVVLQLIMGWAGAVLLPLLQMVFVGQGMVIFMLGPVWLTFGITFQILGNSIPIYKFVWQVIVLSSTLLIFVSLQWQMDIDGGTYSGNFQ